jgi:Ser/Thr protein kinase RdoA (MazF antagonist)
MNYLFKQKISVPRLYKNKENSFLSKTEVGGKIWHSVLMEFIYGEHVEKYNEELVRNLGEVMANFHEASINYLSLTKREGGVRAYNNEFLKRIDIAKINDPEVKNFIERSEKFIYHPTNIPATLIHADLTQDNFLVVDNKIKALLDFDDMYYEYMILDIATTGRDILSRGDSELLKMFLESYDKVRKISKEEVQELKNFMHLKNYFIGSVVLFLCGEDGEEMKVVLETEKKINEVNVAKI